MIQKIISGGQTGADQAALDVAIKLEIPHGGWIPDARGKLDRFRFGMLHSPLRLARGEYGRGTGGVHASQG